jgi:YfiR/HmsC-like
MGLLNRHILVLLALAAGWFLSAGEARGQLSREYDVKAVFLYNFASFVGWPDSAFAGPEAPFVVGILGQDPFGRALEEVVAGERVKNRPLVLKRVTRIEEAVTCHILFISASEKPRMKAVMERTRNLPVLTVADVADFAAAGGVIGFRTEENRLKIEVNVEAARYAGISVSSKLLKVARVIGEPYP